MANRAAAAGRMPLDQARQILGVENAAKAGTLTRELVMEQFTRHYEANDVEKGGSFYIQSKVWNAKEVLLDELKKKVRWLPPSPTSTIHDSYQLMQPAKPASGTPLPASAADGSGGGGGSARASFREAPLHFWVQPLSGRVTASGSLRGRAALPLSDSDGRRCTPAPLSLKIVELR